MTNVLMMISQIMKEAGINLFPAEDSSKYVSIQNKVSCLNKAFVATILILIYHINYWNFQHAGTQIFF